MQVHLNVLYSQLLGQDLGEAFYSPEIGTEMGMRQVTQCNCSFRRVPVAIKKSLRDFYTVLVKIWTNIGTRGYSNTSKTSIPLPSIYVYLPSYILPKDGVNVYANFPMSGKLWPLHSILYSSSSADLDKYWNQRL
jgi:hypothetical protein